MRTTTVHILLVAGIALFGAGALKLLRQTKPASPAVQHQSSRLPTAQPITCIQRRATSQLRAAMPKQKTKKVMRANAPHVTRQAASNEVARLLDKASPHEIASTVATAFKNPSCRLCGLNRFMNPDLVHTQNRNLFIREVLDAPELSEREKTSFLKKEFRLRQFAMAGDEKQIDAYLEFLDEVNRRGALPEGTTFQEEVETIAFNTQSPDLHRYTLARAQLQGSTPAPSDD